MVQTAFGNAESAGSITLVVGVYAFALQIYGDFSGYTDIARGSARLLGIDLMRNFEQPYLSRTITEFWRRWHISLSTWLRDYLYVPLGGNRGGRWVTARNLMITMVLGGLWHGAAWTFVVWGVLHGVLLAVHRALRDRRHRDDQRPLGLRDVPAVVGTFHVVCVAWIFFRAATFEQARHVLEGIVAVRGGAIDQGNVVLLAVAAIAVLALDLSQRTTGEHSAVLRLPAFARGAVYGAMALTIVTFAGGTPVPFLYFQF
jgi:D-alanyl-lipoteichoic acid acyltransferase DltB (MBOAT superfamily)